MPPRTVYFEVEFTRGAVAIFSFQFHVLYFPVGNLLTASYLTKHENQIVFHTVKQDVNFCGKKNI